MHLLAPELLWLAVLLPLVFLAPRRQVRRGHSLVRVLVFTLVIFTLAQPVGLTRQPHQTLVLVLDGSASVTPARVAAAGEELDRLLGALPDSTRPVVLEVGDGSALGDALGASAREIPPGGRGAVILWSDGLATDRTWARAVQDLTARGLPVHARSLETPTPDLRAVAVRPAGTLTVGHTGRVQVDIAGQGRVDVVLESGGRELGATRGVELRGRATAVIEIEPPRAGFLPVTATVALVDGRDARPGNESLAATLPVDAPLRVLYAGGRMQAGGARLGELVGGGFEVVDAGDLTPESIPELDGHDVVLLDDRPAAQVPEAVQQAIASRVVDSGLGLVASGGRAAFAAGGYHETPLEALLPVELLQNQEKRDPSTTLVVIIDTSGSMGGMRVILAKEVARLAMKRLLPHDKVGIVEFYGAKRWAAPIQPASNRIELERALNRLDAGGGTVILPAIEEAFYGLQNVDTRTKHVLILTDGGVESGAFEPLLRRMAEKGINVSTVLIGPEAHSEFLVNLSNWGKGRFYSVPNRFNLPEVLLKQPASAKLSTYREGEHALRSGGGRRWWGDVDPDSVPPLAGYVQARQRPGAENPVVTARGEHPVLASWRYGLGRATALMTEPTGPGTEPWRDWEGHGPFLARILSRTAGEGRHPFRCRIDRDGLVVRVTATRRRDGDDVPVITRLDPRDGDAARGATLELRERAEGVFTASFLSPADREARVSVAVRDRAAAGSRLLVAPPAAGGVALELHVDPGAALDLSRLAATTGGRQLQAGFAANEISFGGPPTAPRAVLWWPWSALLALLAYLADVLLRRLAPASAPSA